VADELDTPLGQDTKKKPWRFKIPVAVPQVIAGLLGLCIMTFAGWAVVANNPLGGEPMIVASSIPTNATLPVVTSAPAQAPNKYDGPPSAPDLASVPPASAGTNTITIIDGSTGKRQVVPIAAPQGGRTPPEQQLLEATRHGAIPKIGPEGKRPSEIYARVAKLTGKPNSPRIAIVINGLGVGGTATQSAMSKLPGPVTFAFGPHGFEIDRTVAKARSDGHEVLLQIPMEPFDYPDNDPGPQTLLVSLTPEQNVDRLHWLMSRFQGYVGLSNFMGARFTASEPALAPVLKEAAQRGLIYVDDGSSHRSLAGQIASANNLTFAKAEIVIDATPTPPHIDRALAKLEQLAKERGVAVGIASALPASIDRIAVWAKAVESRGFVLVPISAVAAKPNAS
jgi:polysaccharide deacetylase 2 family uncharacterized protein YibQ